MPWATAAARVTGAVGGHRDGFADFVATTVARAGPLDLVRLIEVLIAAAARRGSERRAGDEGLRLGERHPGQ